MYQTDHLYLKIYLKIEPFHMSQIQPFVNTNQNNPRFQLKCLRFFLTAHSECDFLFCLYVKFVGAYLTKLCLSQCLDL